MTWYFIVLKEIINNEKTLLLIYCVLSDYDFKFNFITYLKKNGDKFF